PTPAYVSAGDGVDAGACPVTAPCATLNYALSQITSGGQVIIVKAGVFGPIVLDTKVSISGAEPNVDTQIVGDTTAAVVGCVGSAPAATCNGHGNAGYAVDIVAGVNDKVQIGHVLMSAGPNGNGALRLLSGGQLQIGNDVFRGNGTVTNAIVSLVPNNPGTTQAQVYFSNSDVGFNNSANSSSGAVLVQPIGTTSLKLHFNHVEVHNTSFGIRTDSTSLSAGASVATFISDSEFFSFPNAAVNAFSLGAVAPVNAAFDTTRILNAGAALRANGSLSFVVLTNNTVSGNAIGVQVTNGATVLTSVNNTITGNGPTNNQNVVGTITNAPLQ
ncbi:MAG TPA: hypothetical protein VNR65_09370, partial [Geobacterales bacterium]|nr:hypothetical protein [Geobacterales bacterium]